MKVAKIKRGLGGTAIVFLDDGRDLELTTEFVKKIGLMEQSEVESIADGQGEAIFFSKHYLGRPQEPKK